MINPVSINRAAQKGCLDVRGRSHRQLRVLTVASSLAFVVALVASAPALAQTWTGDFFGVWNQALNWSPTTIPNSSTADVFFTGNALGTVNISSSVQCRPLSFSNPTGSYMLTSNSGVSLSSVQSINVAAGVTGRQTINLANIASGSLLAPAFGNLTITNNSTAAGTTLVIGPSTVIGIPGTAGLGDTIFNGAGTTQAAGGGPVRLAITGSDP